MESQTYVYLFQQNFKDNGKVDYFCRYSVVIIIYHIANCDVNIIYSYSAKNEALCDEVKCLIIL